MVAKPHDLLSQCSRGALGSEPPTSDDPRTQQGLRDPTKGPAGQSLAGGTVQFLTWFTYRPSAPHEGDREPGDPGALPALTPSYLFSRKPSLEGCAREQGLQKHELGVVRRTWACGCHCPRPSPACSEATPPAPLWPSFPPRSLPGAPAWFRAPGCCTPCCPGRCIAPHTQLPPCWTVSLANLSLGPAQSTPRHTGGVH